MDHDRLFKTLLTTFLFEFIELFLPELAQYMEPTSLEPVDKEVFTHLGIGDRREADLLVQALVRGQTSCFLIHLEHQAQPQAEFARRMFRYFSLFTRTAGCPSTRSPCCHTGSRAAKNRPPIEFRFPIFVPLTFHFKVIQLNRMDWRRYLRSENPVAVALMTRMHIQASDRHHVKLACLRQLVRLRPALPEGSARLISVFIDQYLPLAAKEEKLFEEELGTVEGPEKEAIMEFTTSWKEEGRQEGIEQAGRNALVAVLQARFGPMPDDVRLHLVRIRDREVLRRLARLAAVSDSMESFRAGLPPTHTGQPRSNRTSGRRQ